jgi:hypothetical protein
MEGTQENGHRQINPMNMKMNCYYDGYVQDMNTGVMSKRCRCHNQQLFSPAGEDEYVWPGSSYARRSGRKEYIICANDGWRSRLSWAAAVIALANMLVLIN